ncbi:MAG TPA: hypothetical protein VLI55_03325, partial [Bryobacteraceae bacterium]|nr:hypothetical protein [Bryobacteraceae bacterium]
VLEAIYAFKQRLCYLLLKKHQNRKKCQQLAHRFLWHVSDPVVAGGAPLVALGKTLFAPKELFPLTQGQSRARELAP